MASNDKEANKLINEKSPYLLQHAYNPIHWYSWSEEAFVKAKNENKPIFLSIGYSTCHWCHVMAHESFEDQEVAKILNEFFVSIKVDREERPDIDNIYMTACQAFTGSGGWPLTTIMTPDQKPFFVGTYIPKIQQHGMIGLIDLLMQIKKRWEEDKEELINISDKAVNILLEQSMKSINKPSQNMIEGSIIIFKKIFDNEYGGFGNAPKFPTPHNLLFLLKYYEISKDISVLGMVEKTLLQMYKGGIFDHIGFGFSRYSTDRYWLIPHFEKMLYDNALLTIAYVEAYETTKNNLYKTIATKTINYVLKELYNSDGGFYCAEDADSDGIEGKFYAFEPHEIIEILGEENGNYFNSYFDITKVGNFEGKNIPNLIKNEKFDDKINKLLNPIYEYRKKRTKLHKDDKCLCSWNSLMIVAFTKAYRILGNQKYLEIALKSNEFIKEHLLQENKIYTSTRNGKRSKQGFLDDYSFYIYAQIELYQATLENTFLEKANHYTNIVIKNFFDSKDGGFYLNDKNGEQLIFRPKDIYDGAIPSGNSVMTYNLIKLSHYNTNFNLTLDKQMNYMDSNIYDNSLGSSFYLYSLLYFENDNKKIICVLKEKEDIKNIKFPKNYNIIILEEANDIYPLKNNLTTFYICDNYKCLPATNKLK